MKNRAREYARAICSDFLEHDNMHSREQLIEFAESDYLHGHFACSAIKDKEIEELKSAISCLLPLAEFSYEHSVRVGAHQEFLSEDREAIIKAK